MATRQEIERAAKILRDGGVVAFPTETVYGLGANALNEPAIARIYRIKGRPSTSPLIVHVPSTEDVRQVVSEWPDIAEVLARRFWPGPLTLVLRKRPELPTIVTAGLHTVGVRVPAHPVALELLSVAKVPVAAPSANRFTEVSPTEASHVRDSLGEGPDMILDGGPANVGIESTVLSLVGPQPVLLRPGMVGISQLEDLIGSIQFAGESSDEPHASPGLHAKHYSPRTRVVIGPPSPGLRSGYLWRKAEISAARNLQMPLDPSGYAQKLYAALHGLDQAGLDEIAIEPVPDGEEWSAIRDRLQRASSTR